MQKGDPAILQSWIARFWLPFWFSQAYFDILVVRPHLLDGKCVDISPGPCMQKLALLRSLLFFVAWVIVGLQTLRASTVREDLSSHHVLVLMGLAAAGFVANVALLAHQWRCGRFDHASLFPSPTFLSRYIEMSQNDTEVREMLQERV